MEEIKDFYYNRDRRIIEINEEEIDSTGIHRMVLIFEEGKSPEIEIIANRHEAIRRKE